MKPRILIVDDERSMCELLEADLRCALGRMPSTEVRSKNQAPDAHACGEQKTGYWTTGSLGSRRCTPQNSSGNRQSRKFSDAWNKAVSTLIAGPRTSLRAMPCAMRELSCGQTEPR